MRPPATGMAGWAPLAEPGRGRRRLGHGGGRFLALAGASLAAAAMAALLAYLLATDPAPGLSGWSLAVLTLAAVVVSLLLVRAERSGALALFRTLAEYGIVALLVLLLIPAAAPPPVDVGRDQPAAIERQDPARPRADQASQLPPGIRHVVGIWSWLADRWREADERIDRQTRERLDREQQRSRAATTLTTLRRPAYRFRPAGGPPPPDHPDQGGNRP
jgi:hypothetical protein